MDAQETTMSDRTLKLLLIDPDLIFRTGLRVVLEQFSELQVVGEAQNAGAALQILASSIATSATTTRTSLRVDLVVLEINLGGSQPSQSGWQLCKQLKTLYPNLSVLLLSSLQKRTYLEAARQAGADGYCFKGTPVSELVAAIRQVACGSSYWQEGENLTSFSYRPIRLSPINSSLAKIRNHLRLSGLQQIDASLAEVTDLLQIPGLPLLEQAFLAGQRRELLASRWLVNQLLASPVTQPTRFVYRTQTAPEPLPSLNTPLQDNSGQTTNVPIANLDSSQIIKIQATLFESTLGKLQLNLENLTSVPLEIDIFREDKKREVLCLILQKIEDVLNQLRFSQVQPSQLLEMQPVIMRDLWQAAITDFFGRYSTLQVGERNLQIVNLLLQDAPVVQTAILDEVPLVVELFSYLLFQTPLIVDNVSHAASSPEAMERAESLLDNLLIQLANGVVQPLLNRLADVEAIKQSFYDRRLISNREIERFRNNLSWKYRLINYIAKPKAIFESRYELFVLASRGIAKISIYAPRNQELTQLSGIPLAVTLVLETRDAITPRLRAAVTFLGAGVVYILTQVIGRAIGLIGRGILQGIGGSPDNGRNKERTK